MYEAWNLCMYHHFVLFPSSDMVTGTMVISLTNPIQNADFEVLVKGNVTTSWGAADFYVQEKLTPAKRE